MDAGVIHYLPSSTGRALARTEPAPGNDYTSNLYSRVGNHSKQLRKHFDPRPPNWWEERGLENFDKLQPIADEDFRVHCC